MDMTESPAEPNSPPLQPEASESRRSSQREIDPALRSAKREGGPQSKIPPIFFWILGAAVLFRIITSVADRGKPDAGAGLVRWQPHERAVAAAHAAGKPVLYDFTAGWCAPCHRLDSEGWGDSGIAAAVNDGFLPARVEDRQREEGSNPRSVEELQRRYSVSAFPTLVVTGSGGQELARMEGYGGKERLAQFLGEARKKAGK